MNTFTATTAAAGPTGTGHRPTKRVGVEVGPYLRVEGIGVKVTKHSIPSVTTKINFTDYVRHVGVT